VPIDERLIAAAIGAMNLFAKPLQQIVIDADRDPRLPSRPDSMGPTWG
jgi:hypothetical protein